MQTSQGSQGKVHKLYQKPVAEASPYWSSKQIVSDTSSPDNSQVSNMAIQAISKQFFTLESFPESAEFVMYDSPSAVSSTSTRSSFSPQGSNSYFSDPNLSSDIAYGSPVSGSSGVIDNYDLSSIMKELEIALLGNDSDMADTGNFCSFHSEVLNEVGLAVNETRLMEMVSRKDVKEVLFWCARAVSDKDVSTAGYLMDVLGEMVSVSGSPIERLAAYMLEGLRARLESSGHIIHKKLRCERPSGKELLSYMHILTTICPYYNFAYQSSHVIIQEAMVNEGRIHIIDFQIAMGSQWMSLIESLAQRPGGAPYIRVTGVDDDNSAYARGGDLQIIGEWLTSKARSCGVPFEFHAAAMSGCEVNRDNLGLRPGEAVAVNFPYMLHHMPDESVSTHNHRDRLLRLVKSIGPKVVVLVEQESNTNTSPFLNRFNETLDYYTAMFESIDVALPRDDRQRINAEQHCLARDIVNMIACEDEERVERHELLGKWKLRLQMAGFNQCALSSMVKNAEWNMISKYHTNYRISELDGALFLGWKNRQLCTTSAWR
ncbi:Scarecrow-like protein [Drosera capensis]